MELIELCCPSEEPQSKTGPSCLRQSTVWFVDVSPARIKDLAKDQEGCELGVSDVVEKRRICSLVRPPG